MKLYTVSYRVGVLAQDEQEATLKGIASIKKKIENGAEPYYVNCEKDVEIEDFPPVA